MFWHLLYAVVMLQHIIYNWRSLLRLQFFYLSLSIVDFGFFWISFEQFEISNYNLNPLFVTTMSSHLNSKSVKPENLKCFPGFTTFFFGVWLHSKCPENLVYISWILWRISVKTSGKLFLHDIILWAENEFDQISETWVFFYFCIWCHIS